MSVKQLELADRISSMLRARATWLVPAANTVDVIAKIGLMGPADRLVAFADDFPEAFDSAALAGRVVMVDDPSPASFISASGWIAYDAEEDLTGWGDSSLVREGSPASYAYSAGRNANRLFWFVPSIGGVGMRVADLRRLARAAATVGAVLIVDNTLPSAFGCNPLEQGACISLEALDRVCAGEALRKLVSVSVARSFHGRGIRAVANVVAEDAFRLLAFGLGDPYRIPSSCSALSEEELEVLERGLDSLPARMQAHFDHARALAEYLRCHPQVGRVFYPGLDSHADHGVAPSILKHGFGPALDVCLTGDATASSRERLERFLALCPVAHRDAPAGGAPTRMGIVPRASTSYLRIFAGTDDPLYVADSLDQAFRLFCDPIES